MSHGRNRLPTRRSRRLAGLGPSSLSSNTDTMTSPRVGSIIMDEDDDMTQASDVMPQRAADDGAASTSRATAVEGRRSPYRRFSDPTFGEGGSAGTSAGRHSASSTTSPERASTSTSGPGSSSSGAGQTGSSVGQDEAGGSAEGGGRPFGRRGAVGGNRRAGQGTLLRAYTEQFGAVPVQGESFCRCPQQGQSRDLHCSCGEDDQVFEWKWDRQNKSVAAEVSDSEREVRFHVNYSSGTAAIRGSEPMIDRQYFWEVKMTTPVYGTDMMVGIGTANVDVDAYRYNFCSILGRDSESWGLSYYGKAQTRGVFTNVPGARFGQGSIIGVHLDTWLGRLLFYKNRKPLGAVFTGLRGKQLFPMVSSTAARTGMKLIKACSYSTSLQFLCCCALRKLVPPQLDVTTALHLPPGLHDFLVNNLDWLLRPSELGTVDWQQHFAAASSTKRDRRTADLDLGSSSDDESAVEVLQAKRARLAPVVDGLSDFDEEPDRDADLPQTSSHNATVTSSADADTARSSRHGISEYSSTPADSTSSDALS